MEQDTMVKEIKKALIELKKTTKELKSIKGEQREATKYSATLFLLAVGVAFVLSSANILFEALHIEPRVSTGIIGILLGLFLMLLPMLFLSKAEKEKRIL